MCDCGSAAAPGPLRERLGFVSLAQSGRTPESMAALAPRVFMQVDEAIKSDRMKPSEAMRLLDDYERGLKAYTYLSF